MIQPIGNNISFKKVTVKDDETTKKSMNSIFNSRLKKDFLKFELSLLDDISKDRDVFISAKPISESKKSEGNDFEIIATDKNDRKLSSRIIFSDIDGILSLSSTFGIFNKIISERLEK